jgi:hypothetical protein
MEFFNFEPEEYQILEEIEVDETIQRPEKVRFYTLEDQLVDATEKLIPRDRRYTRFELEKIKSEVQRFEDLYRTFVIQTIDGYEVQAPKPPTAFDWVFPAHPPIFERYVDEVDMRRIHRGFLMSSRAPGYYPRLLSLLPKVRLTGSDVATRGIDYPIYTPTKVMDEDVKHTANRIILPESTMLHLVRHEDQTYTTTLEPVSDTQDSVKITGYRIRPRPVDIPNPNPDHPFFRENTDSFLDSTSYLDEVLPSISAIMEHGVPVTRDPYGEGLKYLKVYDVKLQNIPWNLWRTRFPPVESVTKTPQVEDLKFPKPAQNAPSEKILKAYGVPYAPGTSARKWLMEQPDGGELIVRALLADSFTNGSVPAIPGLSLGPLEYPPTTLEQCILTGKIFEEFQTAGVVRRIPGKKGKTPDDDGPDTFVCVPPEFVLQERRQLGYVGRVPFKEEAPAEILKNHVDSLGKYRVVEKTEKKETEAKTPARPVSDKRVEVLAILDDEHRVPVDKTRDVRELLKTAVLEKQVYSDTDGLFVVCSHTLAILNGDLASDRRKFYEDWTAQEDGFRVCRFCGERIIREDAIVQDEYDSNGRRINIEAMDQVVYTSDTLAHYITGIKKLQSLFKLDNPVENTIYTLLTILHVLPEAGETERFLLNARRLEANIFKSGAAITDTIKIQKGVLGIAMTIVMLQGHLPLLIPRRSFGSRPLKLDGYPRDKAKDDGVTIVDSMIRVITATYDAFPTAVKGPSAPLIRAVLRNSGQIKKAVFQFLDVKVMVHEEIKAIMSKARARYAELPPPTAELKTLIDPVIPSMKLGVVEHAGECRTNMAVLASSRPPKIHQEEPPLKTGILPAKNSTLVLPSKSRRTKVVVMPEREIVARRNVGPGTIKYAIDDGWRTNLLLASRLSDLFQMELPIATVDSRQDPDSLRDIAKGYVFEALQEIQKSPVKLKKFAELRNTDITLLMLSAKIDLEMAAVNRVLARQRKTFVQRMAEKSDFEREIIEELKRRGMAPIIITTEDRELFAGEIENELRPRVSFEEVEAELAVPEDEGVGLPQAPEGPEEDTAGLVVDGGDYGDVAPLPVGRDPPFASLTDDAATSV